MRSRPGVLEYEAAHWRKRMEHFFFTSGSEMESVAATRRRSRRGSSTKARWNRVPAFSMRPSRMVRARSCLWTLPYFLDEGQIPSCMARDTY